MFMKQGMDDVQVRGAATDIFSYLVEYNPSMVREFVMQESQQNDDVSSSTKSVRNSTNSDLLRILWIYVLLMIDYLLSRTSS